VTYGSDYRSVTASARCCPWLARRLRTQHGPWVRTRPVVDGIGAPVLNGQGPDWLAGHGPDLGRAGADRGAAGAVRAAARRRPGHV